MTRVAQPVPEPALTRERELQVICARVRLMLYQQIAWRQARTAEDLAADPWQDREARDAWSARDERGRELAGNLRLVETAIAHGLPRLDRLAHVFGLEPREASLIQICLAMAIAPELCGAMLAATGRAMPTEASAAGLLGEIGHRFLRPESPLRRWQLVHPVELGPGEPAGIALDPAIHDWFAGVYAVDEVLVEHARPVEPVAPLASWPVDELVAQVEARWGRDELAPHVRIAITAPAGSGRRSLAAAVAARLGLGLLAIDADRVDDASWPMFVRRVHRHAFLTRTAPAFVGDSIARRGGVELAGGFPLVFACVEPGYAPAPSRDVAELVVEVRPATAEDRAVLWRTMVPGAERWPAAAIAELVRRSCTTPADLAFAARRGVTTAAGAAAAVRDRIRGRLGELAQPLECTFAWDDLVLPPALLEPLRDFEYEARERAAVWDQPALRRLFPQGRGLFALFTGPPGTGKTMAAQVIASSLGLDLYRISLSAVVSKYIGETAKNLERVLGRAEHMDALLLFDEADALFGKRTEIRDAHDRYANTDTNHLLQAIESYGGVAILASNKKANIDGAFLRRLRYVVEFPQPDLAERLELWRRLTGALCGEAPLVRLAGALPAFAAVADVSGAQIKLAVLAAVFAARREHADVAPRHLAAGLARELVKDGRSLAERDRERLVAS